jgi:hypothetical protein
LNVRVLHGYDLQFSAFHVINISESSLVSFCFTVVSDHIMVVYSCSDEHIVIYLNFEVVQISFCNFQGFCHFNQLLFCDKSTFAIDKNIITGGILLQRLVRLLLEFCIEITHHFFASGNVECIFLAADYQENQKDWGEKGKMFLHCLNFKGWKVNFILFRIAVNV